MMNPNLHHGLDLEVQQLIICAMKLHRQNTIHCFNAQGEDMREGNSPSWFNSVEAVQVMMYIKSLVNNTTHGLSYDDIGIITPYRKQVKA